MLRCFSTLGCPELELEAVFALAARHGIQTVELRALGGSLELPAYLAAQFGAPAKLAERLRDARVGIAALNASLHLVGGEPRHRDELLALAPWAEALGVKWLRVFDGGQQGDATELRS